VFERLREFSQGGRERVTQLLAGLSPQQRALLFRGVPVLLVALAVGVYLLQRVHYRPLFADLSPQDAALAIKELEAQKIPYILRKDGTVIEVPEEVLYRTRVELAGKGIPSGGGSGFELFEQTPFGMSEFTQRVNYLRALQGELTRTISALAAVQSCRVHLALPTRSAFLGPEEKASASVVIELRPGYQLKPEHVQGIINLVAASVSGLAPEQVSLVDTSGRPLRPVQAAEERSPTELLHGLKAQAEQELEGRIQSMLEPILGEGRAVARASVELDFRETQRTQEAFDPTGQVVRSHQEEREEPAAPAGGVPGVQTNVPGGDGGKTLSDGTPSKKSSQTSNYEITRTTSQVAEPRGQLRRLSVAVVVDGKYEGETYVARTAEELNVLKAVVMKAVGFNAERGDQVEVANIAFTLGPPPRVEAAVPFDLLQWIRTPQGMGSGGGAFLLLLLLFLFTRKRRQVRLAEVAKEELAQLTLPQEGQEVGSEQPAGEAAENLSDAFEKITIAADPRREELVKLAHDNKDLVVQIIRVWLKEEKLRVKAEVGDNSTPS
jgi:flagellar M-ring protein FliF